jgi:hypothetical protein
MQAEPQQIREIQLSVKYHQPSPSSLSPPLHSLSMSLLPSPACSFSHLSALEHSNVQFFPMLDHLSCMQMSISLDSVVFCFVLVPDNFLSVQEFMIHILHHDRIFSEEVYLFPSMVQCVIGLVLLF